ncbi:MAG: proline dehydrogenase [Paenibacillus sp.]|nr:proline dehydrogenase [Paenibacillus sp.]
MTMDIAAKLYRKTVLAVAGNRAVQALSLRYGKRWAAKFVAGDTAQDALRQVRQLNKKGIMSTIDHLGESISALREAESARDEYVRLLKLIGEAGLEANVSLKPTQFGLELDPARCYAWIRDVAAQAAQQSGGGGFVRLDMEGSPHTQATLDIARRLHAEGLTGVGTVIQASLRRSERDVADMLARGIRLRLVKGAYKEPGSIAWQSGADIAASFRKLIRLALDSGVYTAIATHDERIIGWTQAYAEQHGIAKSAFEFQMLYGLRTTRQAELADAGYRMRCYVPYGTMWYPYYTRRLAEKPAHLWMVLKHQRS